MRAPTNAKEALEHIDTYERVYKEAYSIFSENEKYYDGDFEDLIHIPEEYPLTIPTTLRAVVDEACDNVIPGSVQITYSPRTDTKTAEDDADLVRLACKAAIRNWRSSGDFDQIREMAKHLFMHGLTGAKLESDFSLWPVLTEEEEKELEASKGRAAVRAKVKSIKKLRQKHFPLMLRALPPTCIMPDDTEGSRKTWFIERYGANASEVRSIYDEYNKDFRTHMLDVRYKVHEICTSTWVDRNGKIHRPRKWVFVDRECVTPEEGVEVPYDDLPYKHRFSGFGRQSYEGRPELKAVGFYTPQIKSLGSAEARRLSQLDAIVAQLAFPIGLFPSDVQDEAIDLTPGTINFVPDKVLDNADKLYLRTPIPDRSIMTSLDALSSQIQRGTTQEPLRGSPIPGTDSAAQYGLYTQQAKLRLTSVQDALEIIVSWACSEMLRRIENEYKAEVSIPFEDDEGQKRTVMIGPKNIKGNYEVKIAFMPTDEQIKERRLALANDAMVKGGLSAYDALEYAGFEDPNRMIYRRIAWDVMNEPEVRRALGKKWLKEYGIDVDEEKTQEIVSQTELQAAVQQLSAQLGMGGQDPDAAMEQQGLGPMEAPPGAPPEDPSLEGAAGVQQGRI